MNPTNPKPTWVHIVTAVGVTSAIFGSIGNVFLIIAWHNDGLLGRLSDKVIGLPTLGTMLLTFICGIILLKPRKILGTVLVAIAIGLFIFVLLTPEL